MLQAIGHHNVNLDMPGTGIGFDGFEYGQVHFKGMTRDLEKRDRPIFAGVNLDRFGAVKSICWGVAYFTVHAYCFDAGGEYLIFDCGRLIHSSVPGMFTTIEKREVRHGA